LVHASTFCTCCGQSRPGFWTHPKLKQPFVLVCDECDAVWFDLDSFRKESPPTTSFSELGLDDSSGRWLARHEAECVVDNSIKLYESTLVGSESIL